MATSRAAGPMTADLVGSERVRRHPHRRARSAPQCGAPAVPALFGSGSPSAAVSNAGCATGQPSA